MIKLLVFLAATAAAMHENVRMRYANNYSGFQVLRTFPKDNAAAESLEVLRNSPYYDFWTEVRVGGPVDIMATPDKLDQLIFDLKMRGIQHEVMIPDVQKLIELENAVEKDSMPVMENKLVWLKAESRKLHQKCFSKKSNDEEGHNMTWDEYHSLDDIYSYLDYLEATYSDMVSVESIGNSTEGRDMRVVKVCRGGCGNKKMVWIDGGIHAREWISPATVTWMLKELVENDGGHPDLTENLDWYILPSHNPDGYAYSREHDRMWRKTRSNHGSAFGCKEAYGEPGASNNKCSETYHGPSAFSEPESKHVSDYITRLGKMGSIIFYNSVHSYSQVILLPWGFQMEPPPDYNEMLALANKGKDALYAVHGMRYEAGCIPCLLYEVSGSSVDWAKGVANIGFTTSMELRDRGQHGFILPADQIIPTAEEVWAFHLTVLRELMAKMNED